jgi:hypothetical protein
LPDVITTPPTRSSSSTTTRGIHLEPSAEACNIGPAEIRRRRQGAVAGVAVSGALTALALAVDAPPAVRLALALPYAGAIVSILQVRWRVCVNFAARGIANFGELGEERAAEQVAARAARRAGAEMVGIGLVGGVVLGALVTALGSR